MTDNNPQPELVASANLEPISPKPINLSSPSATAIPVLQDQVDTLYTMTLSPSADETIGTAPSEYQLPVATTGNQAVGDVDATQATVMAQSSSFPGMVQNIETELLQTQPETAAADVDDYAKDFDSPPAETVDDSPENQPHTDKYVVAPNEASPSSGTDPAAQAYTDDTSRATSVQSPLAEPLPSSATVPFTQGEEASRSTDAGQLSAPDTETTAPDAGKDGDALDIQAMIDNMTAQAAASEANETADTAVTQDDTSTNTNLLTPSQSSLPPKPPASQQPSTACLRAEEARRFQPGGSHPHTQAAYGTLPSAVGASYSYGAPGAMPDAPGAYPPSSGMNSAGAAAMPVAQFQPAHVSGMSSTGQGFGPQTYEGFLQEERKYVSEAKWDRFPDGSRLFIGNLSSDRVPKKEVFEMFSKYGRMAQISLKQAYGFVQYHTFSEGQAAMENLQGTEVSGRKIHLEFSRAQKKEGDGEKQRGGKGRGRGNGHQNDRERHDGRRGDDRRPNSSNGRGGQHRQEQHGRDRGHWDTSQGRTQGRSRSPYARGSNFRRRSASPYRRGLPRTEADLDIPRRHGVVPDVQLLLLEEVDRGFVDWVQRSFTDRGFKVDVMFLSARLPRELVIQRQIVEGVQAIVEIGRREQAMAKIQLQVFDLSGGRHNARFEQYADLDPHIATELVARAKSQAQMPPMPGYANGQYPTAYYPPPHHGSYPGHQPPPMFNGQTAPYPAQPSSYLSQPQPYAGPPQPQPQQPINLAGLGNLDNATLQKVLAAMQSAPQDPHSMGPNTGADVNSLLGALGTNSNHPVAPSMPSHHAGYRPAPSSGSPANSGENAQHVQNIMAQLSRYRQ